PWDLRYGVSVGSVTGRLKVNCRSTKGSYNNTTAPATAGHDIYDTVSDYNSNGAFPAINPWGSPEYFCAYDSEPDPDERVWEFVSGTGANAIFRDKITKLMWTRGNATTTKNWQNSIVYCNNLVHGSY